MQLLLQQHQKDQRNQHQHNKGLVILNEFLCLLNVVELLALVKVLQIEVTQALSELLRRRGIGVQAVNLVQSCHQIFLLVHIPP